MKKASMITVGVAATAAASLAAIQPSIGLPNHGSSSAAKASDSISFRMVRSSGAVAADCLHGARAHVTVTSKGPVEVMDVSVRNLPPRREFDFFVTQLPNAPFGMAWYQGDMESDRWGKASGRFIGRFNEETFIVAPGVGAAPVTHDDAPFPDADSNPATAPVHTYHLGLWFGSPKAAAAAGCPTTVTPFNGEHNAGIQALSTRQFGDLTGPLLQLKP